MPTSPGLSSSRWMCHLFDRERGGIEITENAFRKRDLWPNAQRASHLDNNRCNIEVLQMPATIPQLVDQELDELIRSAIMQKHLLRFSIKVKSELQNPTTTVSKTESSAYSVFK